MMYQASSGLYFRYEMTPTIDGQSDKSRDQDMSETEDSLLSERIPQKGFFKKDSLGRIIL